MLDRRAAAPLLLLLSGCCLLQGYRTPPELERWQEPAPPVLTPAQKAHRYQERMEEHFLTPEGLVRYRRNLVRPWGRSYGDFADGAYYTGIYLGSQALRARVTGLPEAKAQVLKSLEALRLLMEVTGRRGLLARHFSPAGTVKEEEKREEDRRWRPSPTLPRYDFRSDVSKDQYAGFVFGLGVALAVSGDPEVRARVGELASAAADHLLENDLTIVDYHGRPTTFGDLRGRILCIPVGVNAAISLAIAKVAAESSGEERHREFYRRLVRRGYPGLVHWSHLFLFDRGKRVNLNMTYLALYPLLLLEKDPEVLAALRESEEKMWKHLREERNAFFAFVHSAAGGRSAEEAGAAGRAALEEYPDEKIAWPVDLTRAGFDFERALLRDNDCRPRARRSVPLHLRPRGSSLWVSNPYALVGALGARGEVETAGTDYLQAYWMGRHQGRVE
jgi:hypothetical protein